MKRLRCSLGGVSPFGRNYCVRDAGHSGLHRDKTHEWEAFSTKSYHVGGDGFIRRRARG